jgi:hypothetical protein
MNIRSARLSVPSLRLLVWTCACIPHVRSTDSIPSSSRYNLPNIRHEARLVQAEVTRLGDG